MSGNGVSTMSKVTRMILTMVVVLLYNEKYWSSKFSVAMGLVGRVL